MEPSTTIFGWLSYCTKIYINSLTNQSVVMWRPSSSPHMGFKLNYSSRSSTLKYHSSLSTRKGRPRKAMSKQNIAAFRTLPSSLHPSTMLDTVYFIPNYGWSNLKRSLELWSVRAIITSMIGLSGKTHIGFKTSH